MSKNKKNQEQKKKSFKELLKDADIVWGIVVIIVFLAAIPVVIVPIISNNIKKNNASYDYYVEGADYSNSGISTYYYAHKVIHGDDLAFAISDIRNQVNTMRNINAYLQIQVGEYDYDHYIYNKQGECLAQSSDGATTIVFRKDNMQSISYAVDTGYIVVGNDADILRLIDGVLSVASEDREDAKTFKMLSENEEAITREYRVDIYGEQAFRDVYRDIDTELAESILDSIKTEVESSYNVKYVPHVIYTFIVEDDYLVTICYLVFDDSEHLNWVQDGYMSLSDWQLDDEWYTTDFNDTDADKILNMMETLVNQVGGVLDAYAEENGLIDGYIDDSSLLEESNIEEDSTSDLESESNE